MFPETFFYISLGTVPRFFGFWKMRGLDQMISEVSSMRHFVTCLAREFACNESHSLAPATHIYPGFYFRHSFSHSFKKHFGCLQCESYCANN